MEKIMRKHGRMELFNLKKGLRRDLFLILEAERSQWIASTKIMSDSRSSHFLNTLQQNILL